MFSPARPRHCVKHTRSILYSLFGVSAPSVYSVSCCSFLVVVTRAYTTSSSWRLTVVSFPDNFQNSLKYTKKIPIKEIIYATLFEEWCTVWARLHALLLHFECYTMPGNLPSERMRNTLAVKVNGCRERRCKRILSCIIENMIGHGLYQVTGTGTCSLQEILYGKRAQCLLFQSKAIPAESWSCLPCIVKLLKTVQFLIVGKNFSHCIIILHPFCFLMVYLLFL